MNEQEQPIQEEPAMVPVEEKPEQKPEKKKKGKLGKIILHILAIIVICGASAGATYLWRDKVALDLKTKNDAEIATLQLAKTTLEAQLGITPSTPTTTTTTTTNVCAEVAPNAATIENIKASIASGNTQALEGYMAASVNTILAATEAYGPQTPSQSVAAITTFIGSPVTTTWNMEINPSDYDDGDYAIYFSSISIVGLSSTNKVISFSFNCDGDIDTVFMANSAELL